MPVEMLARAERRATPCTGEPYPRLPSPLPPPAALTCIRHMRPSLSRPRGRTFTTAWRSLVSLPSSFPPSHAAAARRRVLLARGRRLRCRAGRDPPPDRRVAAPAGRCPGGPPAAPARDRAAVGGAP